MKVLPKSNIYQPPVNQYLIDSLTYDVDPQNKWIAYKIAKWQYIISSIQEGGRWLGDFATAVVAIATLLILLQPGLNYHYTKWFQSLEVLKAPGEAGTVNAAPEPESVHNAIAFPIKGQTLSTADISSEFGNRTIFGQPDFHEGIDIVAPAGTEVLALRDGTITEIKQLIDQWQVAIDVGEGTTEFYIHLQNLRFQEGDSVKAGDVIGLVASTSAAARQGRLSTGNHLDIRIKRDGEWISPRDYIQEVEAIAHSQSEPVGTEVVSGNFEPSQDAIAYHAALCDGQVEYGSRVAPHWSGPLKLELVNHGFAPQAYIDQAHSVVGELKEIGFDVEVVDSSEHKVHFIKWSDFDTIPGVGVIEEDVAAYAHVDDNPLRATVLIPTYTSNEKPEQLLDDGEAMHVIREEITHVVSRCLNDDTEDRDPHSVFYRLWAPKDYGYTDLDIETLTIAARKQAEFQRGQQ